jgi:hypothetical protein
MDLARLEGRAFEDMATIMLSAALHTGGDDPDLRVTPEPDRRAVFVGSHTEGVHMSPAALVDFGMSLAWHGFDVDMVPYGTPVSADELADADLVIALPVHDYPTPEVDDSVYDEAWTDDELDVLEDYVADGGILVLTNTAHRMKYVNYAYDVNEDWEDVNALAERFGVRYTETMLPGGLVVADSDHPLMDGVVLVRFIEGNARGFTIDSGEILAGSDAAGALAVVPHGSGEVIVLADLGTLGSSQDPPRNQRLFENIAEYAR